MSNRARAWIKGQALRFIHGHGCRRDALVRFWAKVAKAEGDGCWIWMAGRTPFGYGQFGLEGRVLSAHRVSWELHFGPIQPGLCVLHNCPGGDNPACVRPSHLWVDT